MLPDSVPVHPNTEAESESGSAFESDFESDCWLLIFARYPEPGQTKTRLIPALGAEAATQIYRQLAEHTLAGVRSLRQEYPTQVVVWFTGGDQVRMQSWLGTDLNYCPQVPGNLGQRLIAAVQAAFQAGAGRVVVIGTDCPELEPAHLRTAFLSLHDRDLVLGPARDGGYYLIGLSKFLPELFQAIPWSTNQVYEITLEIARKLGCSVAQLPVLSDVDEPEDVKIWQQVQERSQ